MVFFFLGINYFLEEMVFEMGDVFECMIFIFFI